MSDGPGGVLLLVLELLWGPRPRLSEMGRTPRIVALYAGPTSKVQCDLSALTSQDTDYSGA